MNTQKLYEQEALKSCDEFDKKHISHLMSYVDAGKMSRYKLFSEFNRDYIEGFNIENLQNLVLIQDDIIDKAEMRRKKICYHLVAENPVIDSFFMYNVAYKLTKKPSVIGKNIFKTALGQFLDLKGGTFTKENYFNIVDYKSGPYTINLPLELAGVNSKNLETFSKLFGRYYQILDDSLNFLQKEKTCRDLEEFKVTWFTVWIKSEYFYYAFVQDYFEKKIVSEDLVNLCTRLAKSQEFRNTLNSLLNEISELVKGDRALTQAYSVMYASTNSVVNAFLHRP